MTTFDCPECDHESTHWSPLTGFPHVFWHFFREHPNQTADWGSPFSDEEPPAFEDGDCGGNA